MSTKITIVFLCFCFLNTLSAQTFSNPVYALSNENLAVLDTKTDLEETNELTIRKKATKNRTTATTSYFAPVQMEVVNPNFNIATIKYTLAQTERISVQLIDAQDRPVKIYTRGAKRAAGTYQQEIHLPFGLPEGDYYLSISSPNGQTMIKVGE